MTGKLATMTATKPSRFLPCRGKAYEAKPDREEEQAI